MTPTRKDEKIKFDPPELEEQLRTAYNSIKNIVEWPCYPLDPDNEPEESMTITPETEVDDFMLDGVDDKITISDVLELGKWAKHGVLIDKGTVHCETETVFLLETGSDRAFHILWRNISPSIEDRNLSSDVEVQGGKCIVSLAQGSLPFAIFAQKDLSCHEDYCPSYDEYTPFAIVKHPSGLSADIAKTVCDAFLVELAVSYDLVFTRSSFTEYDYGAAPGYFEDEPIIDYRLRPLDLSLGMGELYQLYLTAIGADNKEWKFISFVKVIEFVSQTVIKRTVHKEIRARLMRPEALRPDSSFIDELVSLVGAQREYGKQKEAVKRTIAECCSLLKLVESAPSFLVNVCKVDEETKDFARALDELSEAIVATRNFLVHAKAAYEKTGKECPDAQLTEFTDCVQEIARQLIIWFGSLPEHARVVG